MKKCKLYNKTHHFIPIYDMNINICFTIGEFKYLCKKYQDYECPDLSKANGFTLMNPENQEVVIGVFNGSLSTIVHEVTHLSLFLLKERGMDPNDSCGENLAYIQTYLFDLVYERMRRDYL